MAITPAARYSRIGSSRTIGLNAARVHTTPRCARRVVRGGGAVEREHRLRGGERRVLGVHELLGDAVVADRGLGDHQVAVGDVGTQRARGAEPEERVHARPPASSWNWHSAPGPPTPCDDTTTGVSAPGAAVAAVLAVLVR